MNGSKRRAMRNRMMKLHDIVVTQNLQSGLTEYERNLRATDTFGPANYAKDLEERCKIPNYKPKNWRGDSTELNHQWDIHHTPTGAPKPALFEKGEGMALAEEFKKRDPLPASQRIIRCKPDRPAGKYTSEGVI